MATYPLVNAQSELGPLVKLSLRRHDISATAVFDVFEEATREQFLAVATPLVDERGAREAYRKFFTALKDETFSTSFLRLHTLVLSTEDLSSIRQVLKKGMSEASLDRLANLNEVIVRPTEEPKNISKTGMLHVVATADGSYLLSFGAIGSGGAIKSRTVNNFDQLKAILRSFNINLSQIQRIKESHSESRVVTTSLENIYTQGLI
jgi:hypothetical protein